MRIVYKDFEKSSTVTKKKGNIMDERSSNIHFFEKNWYLYFNKQTSSGNPLCISLEIQKKIKLCKPQQLGFDFNATKMVM